MAFATANVQTALITGPVKVYCGDWTGNTGDADGTITLNGGRVYLSHFENQDADGTKELLAPNISSSGSTITITIGNRMNVTNGRFLIIYA